MTLSAHLAAARRHLAAVDRLARRPSPQPSRSPWPPEPPAGDRWATSEEVAEAFARLRDELAAE
jgi:hypothetical protein